MVAIIVTSITNPDGVGVGARHGKDTINACMTREMEKSNQSLPATGNCDDDELDFASVLIAVAFLFFDRNR